MPDHEYAPKDSRDVTRQQNMPGKPADWHEAEAAREEDDSDDQRGGLAPDDSRKVTAHQNAPGEPTGWQADKDAAAAKARHLNRADADAAPPPAVPQEDEPFSATDATKPSDSPA